jgi:carboxyl-terminal processing protease
MRDFLRLSSLFLVSLAAIGGAYAAGFATALQVRGEAAPSQTAGGARRDSGAPADGAGELGSFWEVWRYIDKEFYGELPSPEDRVYGAIRGSLRALDDPYTVFTDPTDTEVNRPGLAGEFEGIGAFVTQTEDGHLMIQSPMPGQPAEKAGLLAGDIVIAVDGEDITDLEINEAVLRIRGPRGTVVTLSIVREGEPAPLDIAVERARIEIPSVTEARLETAENQPTVGYLRLTEFASDTKQELDRTLDELRRGGAEAMIVDVRNNPGGLLSSAIEVTSEFIGEGVVVIQEDASGARREEKARPGGKWLALPLVLLVNRGSASASEILAGALRDHDRAVLVGETSFGKGSVQNVHDLSDGSELRVTVAVWRTPDGDLIHRRGVEPDIEVAISADDRREERDPQLERAIEEARRLAAAP